MKTRIWLVIIVFAAAAISIGCVKQSGDISIIYEFGIGNVYMKAMRVAPTGPSTTEIEKGTYDFKGSLSNGANTDASGPDSAAFPQYMYIRLMKMTPATGSLPGPDRATQTQDIRLKINQATGEIAQQKITFAKDMIIDPKKNEYIEIKTRVTGGSIKVGDHLWLTYWNDKLGGPHPDGR